MEFEWLKIEETWKWEKIEKSQAEIKLKEIWDIKKHLENTTNSSNPDIKQKLESNTKMQWEILQFIEDAANNKLSWGLDKFNSKNQDKDNESGLDSFEFANFEKSVNWAIDQIIKLDWVKDLQATYDDTNDKWWLSSPDKWLANKLWVSDNINDLLKWWSFTEEWLKKLWLSEEDLKKMSDNQFDITSASSWKELWILTTKELWEWAESILKLLLNVLPSIILLPRYMAYRVESNASDTKEAEVWQIKLDELSSQNPALEMLNLLWEKWVEMLQKLWEMVKSGKQWDIAMMLVSIAWLIAWWAWLVKTWAKMARKEAVMSARAAWREARTATWREMRNSIRDLWNQAGKVADKANKIDDTLSWVNAIKTVWKVAWWIWTNEAWKQIEAANDASNKVEKVTELSDKEKLYYSNFTDKVPDSLKAEDPVAWINKDGTISYNKAKLEQEYWVKIDWNKWETTFDGMSLKEFTKQNPEKWQAIIDKLKNYKWHESTHRVLEAKWIDRINVNINGQNRIFWQEEISHIVDWSHQISKEEFDALEKALQEKLWSDLKLESDNIRRTDTKNISDKWNDKNTFSREKEAAKDSHLSISEYSKNIENSMSAIENWLLKLANNNPELAKQYFEQLFKTTKENVTNKIFSSTYLEKDINKLIEIQDYLKTQETRLKQALDQKEIKDLESTKLKEETTRLEQERIIQEKMEAERLRQEKANQERIDYERNRQEQSKIQEKYSYLSSDELVWMKSRIEMIGYKIWELKKSGENNVNEIKYLESMKSKMETEYNKLPEWTRRNYEQQYEQILREQRNSASRNEYAKNMAEQRDNNLNAMWLNNNNQINVNQANNKPADYHIDWDTVHIHATPEERAEQLRRRATNWTQNSNW